MSKYTSRCLLGTYVLCIVAAAISAASLPAASPLASTDLICHTSDPADCYPRIFQPTEVFQVVHDDQHLPPGLHVRMDIWKGVKEARLNIPMEGQNEAQDFPAERAVVMVSPPDLEEVAQEPPANRDRLPHKKPLYEAVGKIQPPRGPDGSVGDSGDFQRAIATLDRWNLNADDSILEGALSTLVDLSHDIYYGVEAMKRSEVLRSLVSVMAIESTDQATASRHRHHAASIIANSIQNNPTALQEALKSWKDLMRPVCTGNSCQEVDLIDHIYESLQMENERLAMKAKIYALNGLLKDEDIRDHFLRKKGMDLLLSIFIRPGNEWDSTRLKIAQLVMDTFLDENMGAQLGLWPTQERAEKEQCRKTEHTTDDGCWEYHLGQIANDGSEEDEWIFEFVRLLNNRRGAIHPAAEKEQVSDREL